MGCDELVEEKFENYKKMEDIIYYIGKNAVLKMNVNLFNNSEKMGRMSYHNELKYFNEKLGEKVINIKRSFDYFITIENLKPVNGCKKWIVIRQEDILLFRKVLNEVFNFFNDNFDTLFTKRGGVTRVSPSAKPYELNGLPMNNYLVFAPATYTELSNNVVAGIRMNLSSPDNYVYLSLNKLSGLVECINNADMFLYAQNMITYMGKPEFGTNMYDMTARQEIVDETVAKTGRLIGGGKHNTNSKSYFANKMKELEA